MPTPPDKCTFLPIWAQLPTVTQVSTMVPSSTKAPMLTKLGISTTFLAICDPCRAMAQGPARNQAARTCVPPKPSILEHTFSHTCDPPAPPGISALTLTRREHNTALFSH